MQEGIGMKTRKIKTLQGSCVCVCRSWTGETVLMESDGLTAVFHRSCISCTCKKHISKPFLLSGKAGSWKEGGTARAVVLVCSPLTSYLYKSLWVGAGCMNYISIFLLGNGVVHL